MHASAQEFVYPNLAQSKRSAEQASLAVVHGAVRPRIQGLRQSGERRAERISESTAVVPSAAVVFSIGDVSPASASVAVVATEPTSNETKVEIRRPPLVGNTRLHESHVIHHNRGVYICYRCGSIAVSQPKNLAKPCPGICNKNGAQYLDRWTRGLMPKHGQQWPQTFSSPAATGQIWKPQQ